MKIEFAERQGLLTESEAIVLCFMGWFTKIFKGTSQRGHSHGNYGNGRNWDEPRNSVDELTDNEREEIDYAIALSLAEVDQKGKKVIDDDSQSEDDEKPAEAQPEENGNVESSEEEDEHVNSQPKEDEHVSPQPKEEHVNSQQKEEEPINYQLEEDEQLAKAIQESLNIESPSHYDNGSIFQPYPFLFPSGYRYFECLDISSLMC